MTKKIINKAIQHLGLEIVNTRGDGYSYFLDIQTGYQVGSSVYICYLNQATLQEWVSYAEAARNEEKH